MRAECQTCPVRRDGLCASVTDEQLTAFGTIKRPLRHVRPGACVFAEREPCDTIYVVRRGWAVASTMHENGRRQVLRFVMPGSLVGFEAASDGSMPCTVEALTDLTVCPMPRKAVLRFCQDAPNVALRLASLLAEETIADWRLLGGLGTSSAAERIARLLLELCRRLSPEAGFGGPDVDLPISQGVIADATSLTSVHVCRTLRDMRNDGLLTFAKGHLRVQDWDRLVGLAEMGDLVPPFHAAPPVAHC